MGIIDHEDEFDFIDAVKAEIVYTKTNQVGAAKGMMYYANFVLSE